MSIWAIVLAIFIIAIAFLIGWYWRDRQQLLAQIAATGQIAQTACGPIKYTRVGAGPVVLTVHGWGGSGVGGFNMFEYLADCGFTVLSVARPGYPGTPISVGETMEAQADAIAALLDALHIPSAAVICGSGGGPASLLFALRHPNRCWALVLVNALSRPEPITNTSRLQDTLEKAFQSDFMIWIIAKFFWRSLVESGMGGLNDEIRRDPQKMAALRSIVEGLVLGSQSRIGMDNDMKQWRNHMPKFSFSDIQLPTLIVHSRNDKSVPFAMIEPTLSIPNSKHLILEDGGHTCYIVHDNITHPATAEFLQSHQPARVEGESLFGITPRLRVK